MGRRLLAGVAQRRSPSRQERCSDRVASPRPAREAQGTKVARASARKSIRFEQHDLYIEFNATAGDAGLQLGADAESWRRFTLYDTQGKVLIHIGARGRLHDPFGLSELFLEASEPAFTDVPFNVFKRRFPEGTYRFRGVTSKGPHAGRGRSAVAPYPCGSGRHLSDGGRARGPQRDSRSPGIR
jgi:hypothetical protein